MYDLYQGTNKLKYYYCWWEQQELRSTSDGRRYRCSKFTQHDFIMRSKMSVIKSKMGTIKSKMGRKFEQKRKAKWVKEKANLVKAYSVPAAWLPTADAASAAVLLGIPE